MNALNTKFIKLLIPVTFMISISVFINKTSAQEIKLPPKRSGQENIKLNSQFPSAPKIYIQILLIGFNNSGLFVNKITP